MMREAWIVGAARTAIANFGGKLKDVPAVSLGAAAVSAALQRAGMPFSGVDDVILGNVIQAGQGQNPARQAAMRAGLPETVPAMTVNQVCGSGLKAVGLGAQAILAGAADVIVAGGMESMSQAPFVLSRARWGYRMGDGSLVDTMLHDGLWEIFENYHMGRSAEELARHYGISREQQDHFAWQSQIKTRAAQLAGRFVDEIAPLTIPRGHGRDDEVFDRDEFPRPDTTPEALAKLKTPFLDGGTVTAGNASGINDGAAAIVVMEASKARALGVSRPLAVIRSWATVGVAPAMMGMGPVGAVRKALDRCGTDLASIDLIESNEAFAVQALAVTMELGWDPERLNVNGGAIALGHPIGASGARILVTLLYEMQRRDARRGLATLCIGGGMGIAMVLERAC